MRKLLENSVRFSWRTRAPLSSTITIVIVSIARISIVIMVFAIINACIIMISLVTNSNNDNLMLTHNKTTT